MLDSFSVQAIQIIEEAKTIASKQTERFVGSEHLLLAMYQTPDSICRFLLQEQAITYENIVDAIRSITVIRKAEPLDATFTNKFQAIIVKAKEIASEVGSDYVFDEHLFYSLLKDGESVACEVLRKLKLELEDLMKDIEEIFSFYEEEPPLDDFELDAPYPFLINLTTQTQIHPYIKRSHYLEQIKYILYKKQKNNPLLIGNAGVGKTAIVEGLAKHLRGETIYQLDLGSMVAGTKYRGELEEKLMKAMEFIKKQKAIVFIDEIHNIVGAGSNDGSLDIANILKPYLSRSDIRLIGATTLEEYYRFMEHDKALMRRFQNIFVEEPSIDETETILMGIKESYEKFHQVEYTKVQISEMIKQCALLIPNRTFPDKAIDVLDETGSRYKQCNEKNVNTQMEAVIRDMTGIHAISVEALRETKLQYPIIKPYYFRFLEQILPHNHIVSLEVEENFETDALFDDLKAVFGFTKEMYLEVNLESYHDSSSLNNLIGSTKGYVGYEQGGIVSEHILKYPMSVIYFRNIKLCHMSIYQFIKKLLTSPSFLDNKGRTIHLKNTIFILDGMYDNKHEVGFFTKEKRQSMCDVKINTIKLKKYNVLDYQALLEKYHIQAKNLEKLSLEQLEIVTYQLLQDGPGDYELEENGTFQKQIFSKC